MSNIQRMLEELNDSTISNVNRYIKGEHVHYRRGRYEREHVTAMMMILIEHNLPIKRTGSEVAIFYFGMYKREMQRRKRKSDYVPWHLRRNER